MKKNYSILMFGTLLLILGFTQQISAQQTLVHPGIAFNQADLDQLKANITQEPWLSAYNSFKNSGNSKLSYVMAGPHATVSRAPHLNNNAWINDMVAIRNLTFMYVFTGDSAYAQKATDMLDAWAVVNTYWGGVENRLDIGDHAQDWGVAAEILRYTYPGWTAANTQHVENYFANVLYPTSSVPNPLYDQNKGALQLKIALAASIFCNDVTRFNQAIEVYRMDAGGGMRNSLPNGETGDTGRDDHWRVQATALVWGAEVAWKQKVDMFSELDNRVLAIAELYHQFAFDGDTMTYIPFGGYASYWTSWGIKPGARTGGMTNIIHNAYNRRLGIPTPHTDRMRAALGGTEGDFFYLKSSDTSTAVKLPPVFYPSEHVQPVSNLTNIDIGGTGLAGSASYNNGIWTLKGAGNSTSNALSFNFKKVSGDTGLVVKIENMSLTTGSSGVMLRESLAPGSRFWDLAINRSGIGRHWGLKAPWWLKIERVNTRIFAYHSQDGIHWTNLNCWYSATGFPAELYLGFYTISNDTSLHNTATFSNVGYSQSAPTGSPEISSATTATTTIGLPFTYNINSSANPTDYSASGLPAGLSLDTATGIISGTPTELGQKEVTLTATNTSGSGTATLILNVLNNQAPAAIASAVISVVNTTQIKLSWPISANATSYSVKRSLTAGGPYTTIQAGINLTSFTDPSPAYEVNNYYVITALTGDLESDNSNEVFANVPPAIPGLPVATNQSDRINLTWDAANGASSYKVKRGTFSGGPYTTIATVGTTSYTDTDVTSGSPYYYVVSSVGTTKESANSAEAFGVPGASSATWSPTPLSDSFNLAANWTGNTLPVNPAILTFGATTDSLLTNDLTLVASRIQFASDADEYTISGNGLTLKNDLVNNSLKTQTFTTPLQLTDQLSVNTTGSVVLNGTISGTGSLRMNSNGTLYIKGSNSTYSGNTTIASGKVVASGYGTGTPSHPTAGPFGTGKIILNGGLLQAPPDAGLALYNDIEVLPGNRSSLYEDFREISLYGKLLGSGNVAHDANSYAGLNLYGDNSQFTGTFTTIFRSGAHRLRFMVPESGSAKADWLLDANAPDCQSIQFKTGTIHFGALRGRGYIRTAGSNSPVISIGALNTYCDYGGTIDALGGNLTVEKVGTGTLRMYGNQQYGGTTTVKKGKLSIENAPASGVFNSPIIIQEGALGGTGVIQSSATLGTGSGPGAILEPGVSKIGTLKVGTLIMNADATYTAEINLGTKEGDKVTATSVTLLNNPKLKLIPIAGELPSGTSYTIVNNTGTLPINGTFKDLPEFSLISAGASNFRITYKGGDGNDVVIFDNRSLVTLTATKDTTFNYTLSAGNNPTSFSLTGLPQGLSFNTTTGEITGTPTLSGIFMLEAKATGSEGTVTILAELTVKPNAVPPAPVLQASVFSAFQTDLSWNMLPASWFVSGYTVKRSETAGGPYVKIAEGIKDSVYSDKGLNAETSYYYVLSASNEVGESANSAEVSVTMPAPSISPMVRELVAAGGNAKVSLNWRGAYEALTYNVKRSLTATGPFSTITNQSETTYTDTDVSNGITYYYVITAVNPAGESVPSTVATAAPDVATFAYWPFNEAAGTSATDIWNNKQIVLEGPDAGWDKGISGSGLKLGGNSYATLPAGAVSTLTDFTIATWVKLDETKVLERLFDFGTGTTNYMFLTTNSRGEVRFSTKVNGGAEQILGAPYAIPVETWVHLAVTLNGTTAVLYADGTEIARNNNFTLNPSMLGNTTQTWIGKSQWPNDPLLKGMVDDFRIYSRSLSAIEIARMQENKPEGTPKITSATAATGLLGRDFEYSITATNSANTYKASGLPAGLSLNTTTGIISGKPTQAGTFMVNLTASNYTNNGTATLTLKIQSNIVSEILATAGDAQTILQWESIINTNYSYRIKRSETPGGPYATIATITGSEYLDAGLTNGTTYYYTIATVDGTSENPNSAEISAQPFVSKYSHWPFDEGSGSFATDVWANRTATLKTAATWTAGEINNGLRLDGTASSYATLPTSVVSPLNDFTISTWVKMDGTSNWTRIFDFGTGTTNYMFLTPKSSTGNPRYTIKNGGGEQVLNSSIAIQTGEWTHIAVTQSGSVSIMYINGMEVGRNNAMTLKPSSLGNTTLNYLGKSQWPDPMLNGTLDDFRIYSKALTATEIKMLNAELGQTITFNALAQKTVGDADFDAGATASTGLPVSYTSSNTSVATIVDGKIHVIASGSVTITAVQPGNGIYTGATKSQTLTVVGPPAVPVATVAAGDAQVTLSWAAANGAATYNVKRSSVSGGPYTTIASATTSIYVDNTSANDSTYYYVVSSVNDIGESANSTEVSAQPFVSKYAYWPFDEGSGTSATDVWNSRTATLKTAATWTAGNFNSGLRLDGTANSYATLPTAVVSSLNDFTVSAWVKLDGTSNWMRIFDFGTGTTNYMFLTPKTSSGTPRYAIKNGGGEQVINSNTAIVTGAWTHIAVTQSGSQSIMYINGMEVGRNSAMTLKPSSLGNTTQNYLGKSQWPDPMLNGTLDDFRIYSKALTPAEIKVLNDLRAQTITFNALAQKTVGDEDFDLAATATSGLPVTYTSSNTSIATIVDGKVHIVASGTSTITASQAGNSDYKAAITQTQVLTVVKKEQSINFAAIAEKTTRDADFDPAAVASSSLAVTYTSSNENVATIVNGKVHLVGGGTAVITASQAGNETYNAASAVTQELHVFVPPAVFAKNIEVELNASGTASITAAQVDNGSISYTGALNLTLDQTTFGCSNVGTPVTVTLTGTDAKGYSSSATAQVTVTDHVNPVLSAPSAQFFCYAGSTYTLPSLVFTDNCGVASISYVVSGATQRSGSDANASGVFNTGTSTVQFTVTDVHGNTELATTSVTVNSLLSSSIPDVYALNSSTDEKNTIYLGYGPSSLSITATPDGGTAPYTYLWSTNQTAQAISVSAAGTYTVIVTDAKGCQTTTSIVIKTINVQCGNSTDKVMVCHNGQEICVSSNAVQSHLDHGDKLGSCTTSARMESKNSSKVLISEENTVKGVTVYPNPVTSLLNIKVSEVHSGATLELYNALGMKVQSQALTSNSEVMSLDRLPSGIYFLNITNGNEITVKKIIKE